MSMIFSKDKQHCKKTYLYLATPIMGVARIYDVYAAYIPSDAYLRHH